MKNLHLSLKMDLRAGNSWFSTLKVISDSSLLRNRNVFFTGSTDWANIFCKTFGLLRTLASGCCLEETTFAKRLFWDRFADKRLWSDALSVFFLERKGFSVSSLFVFLTERKGLLSSLFFFLAPTLQINKKKLKEKDFYRAWISERVSVLFIRLLERFFSVVIRGGVLTHFWSWDFPRLLLFGANLAFKNSRFWRNSFLERSFMNFGRIGTEEVTSK